MSRFDGWRLKRIAPPDSILASPFFSFSLLGSSILNLCSSKSLQTNVSCDSEEKQPPLTTLFPSQPIGALTHCWQQQHTNTELSFPTTGDDLEGGAPAHTDGNTQLFLQETFLMHFKKIQTLYYDGIMYCNKLLKTIQSL